MTPSDSTADAPQPPLPLRPVVAGADAYLAADEVIDADAPAIVELAARLAAGVAGGDGETAQADAVYAEAAYGFVRDRIAHSFDTGRPYSAAYRASDVLRAGDGICFAKSHLLVALLRARAIPAGLCYQRLSDDAGGFVMHGLVAVRLGSRWHRLDARGGGPGRAGQFSLDGERLAWPGQPEHGEVNYPQLYASPPPVVLDALRAASPGPDAYAGLLPAALPTPRAERTEPDAPIGADDESGESAGVPTR